MSFDGSKFWWYAQPHVTKFVRLATTTIHPIVCTFFTQLLWQGENITIKIGAFKPLCIFSTCIPSPMLGRHNAWTGMVFTSHVIHSRTKRLLHKITICMSTQVKKVVGYVCDLHACMHILVFRANGRWHLINEIDLNVHNATNLHLILMHAQVEICPCRDRCDFYRYNGQSYRWEKRRNCNTFHPGEW